MSLHGLQTLESSVGPSLPKALGGPGETVRLLSMSQEASRTNQA